MGTPLRLAITSARELATLDTSVRALVARRGSAWVLLRDEPGVRPEASVVRARALVALDAGARVVVADRLDVALALRGRGVGVQLPERGIPVADARALGGPALPIGASRHDLAGALRAAQDGADWITVAPVFATPSKPGQPALGVDALAEIVRAVRAARPGVVVLALGGIDRGRLAEVEAAGTDGVAAIRAAWTGELDG